MENNSKNYQLVAWTEQGHVRMIPSLACEREYELLDEVIRAKKELDCKMSKRDRHGRFTISPKEEIEGFIAISRAYEKVADYYTETGKIRDAYQMLTDAANCCTGCSDWLWIYDDNSFYPTIPLLRRFYAMHGRVLQLVRQHLSLWKLYRGSSLESNYLTFSADRFLLQEEVREADAWRKAMHLGRR